MFYVFLTPYFHPEDFPFNKLIQELAKTKKILVITGLPNYRKKKYFKGYSIFGPYKECIFNISIIRVPVIPRFGNSKFLIFLFYLSFLFSAFCFGIWIAIKNRGKIIDVLSFVGSPVFTGLIGNLIARISRASSSIWIQDIWPEAISSTVGLKNNFLKRLINNIQEYMWSNADNLFCQSNLLLGYIKEKYPNKNSYLMYNPSRNVTKNIFKKPVFKKNQKKINIVFAGTIGFAQNLEPFIKLAIEDKNVYLFICGDGAAKGYLEKKYNNSRIKFFGWLNEKDMLVIFQKSHFSLITLSTIGRQGLVLPGKVQTYLEYGLPILSFNSGAVDELVKQNNLGIALNIKENETSKKLSSYINCYDFKSRLQMKLNCNLFFKNNFDVAKVLLQYLNGIEKNEKFDN